MDWSDPEALRRLLLGSAWGRAAHAGNPRGRHILGLASAVCGASALAGALAITWFLSSGLGWYGPRAEDELGSWLLVQWNAMYGAWVCAATAVGGLVCGISSLFLRWSLGLTIAGIALSAGAVAATVNAYGLFFWNHL